MKTLDLKAEMKPYIILNKKYNPNRPSYMESIGVSSSRFSKHHVHTKPRIFDFYKDSRHHEVVFVENAREHPYFSNLIKGLVEEEDSLRRAYNRVVEALNIVNEVLN